MFISGPITLPDSSPDRTSTYLAIDGLPRLNYLTRSFPGQTSTYPIILGHLTRPDNTSLHLTAYPALPNHLSQPSTLQLTLLKNFLIGHPP
jgi:hypothetical protein